MPFITIQVWTAFLYINFTVWKQTAYTKNAKLARDKVKF